MVLNKSNQVLEPTYEQHFLSRKHFYLELLESLYFYQKLEIISYLRPSLCTKLSAKKKAFHKSFLSPPNPWGVFCTMSIKIIR